MISIGGGIFAALLLIGTLADRPAKKEPRALSSLAPTASAAATADESAAGAAKGSQDLQAARSSADAAIAEASAAADAARSSADAAIAQASTDAKAAKTAAAVAAAQAAKDAEAAKKAADAEAAKAAAESAAAEPAGATTIDFVMPSYVGTVLQVAQDSVQTYGIFYSVSHDMLADRMQVLDSNWKVCNQTPAAGTRVQAVGAELEGTIDFGVVKLSESCP